MAQLYNYGRTMATPNMPWWPIGAFAPWTAPPFWGPGTYPSVVPPTWAVPPFPYAAPAFVPPAYVPAPDEEIKDFVERTIERDPEVPADADIEVAVHNGVVTLTGTVPNKRIKHAAGDDAWWIPQVIDVHNEIQVSPRRQRAASTGASGNR